MAETPRLDLPYIASSQAQKELVHNISLDRLDLLVQCAVLDRNLPTPPSSPALGDAYIVAAGATGVWAGHANHLALWISSQWEFIAPLPGFTCWVNDETVLVYWSGSAWVIASGGGGSTTFLGLSDTPDAYSGQAGKAVLVNAGGTALEFGTSGGGAPVDATYIVSSANTTLTAERVLTNSTSVTWNTGTAGQVSADIPAGGVTLAQLAPLAFPTLLGRGNPPTGAVEAVTIGAGLTLTGGTLSLTTAPAASDFLSLTDTPDSYAGQAGKIVQVNAGATALEFGAAGGAGGTTLGARVARVATQALGSGVTDTLSFDTETLDQNAYWSAGQPTRLTITTTGWYSLLAYVLWTTGSSQNGHANLNVRVGGSTALLFDREYSYGTVDAHQSVSGIFYLTAGDYLEVVVTNNLVAGTASLTGYLTVASLSVPGTMAATTWLALMDTPDAYTGQGGNLVTVNSGATGLDFTTLTAAGRALLDDADAAAQRTTLGLGTMATQHANAVAITGGSLTGPTTLTVPTQIESLDRAGSDLAAFAGRVTAGTNRWNVYCDGTANNYLQGPLSLAAATPEPNCQLSIRFRHDSISGILLRPLDGDSGSFQPLVFLNQAGGVVGSISTTGAATAYNTSSDVRLKHAIATLVGALDAVRALRPVTFRWNADESQGHGFLAHELQQVIPDAVTGEPEAVDAQGNVAPQQVDHSKLVPWLTAACQELLAQVEALSARVSNLETQLGL